jgi:hypothetical protein
MRDAKAVLETIFDTGEPSAVNAARSVREGVDGKGPDKQEPRWRSTSRVRPVRRGAVGKGPAPGRDLAGGLPDDQHGSGRGRRKRPTEKMTCMRDPSAQRTLGA